MSIILETTNLEKDYFGKRALEKTNLSLKAGRVYGLLGPNGSGKTTFLKLIVGLLQPTGGTFTVCGRSQGIETKKLVSFLSDKNSMYTWMKISDAIEFYQDFFEDFDKAKAFEMLDFLKLDKNQVVKTMSKGMIEKLNLTLAFSRRASLYILDEPLAGTDPVAREQIIKTIIKTWSENASIIISTHLVSEIEHVLDNVIFLKNGEVVLQDSVEDLRETRGKSIYQIYFDIFG